MVPHRVLVRRESRNGHLRAEHDRDRGTAAPDTADGPSCLGNRPRAQMRSRGGCWSGVLLSPCRCCVTVDAVVAGAGRMVLCANGGSTSAKPPEAQTKEQPIPSLPASASPQASQPDMSIAPAFDNTLATGDAISEAMAADPAACATALAAKAARTATTSSRARKRMRSRLPHICAQFYPNSLVIERT